MGLLMYKHIVSLGQIIDWLSEVYALVPLGAGLLTG
jgi:hypothetical protein